MYGNSGIVGIESGSIGDSDYSDERVDLVLDLLSNLYSELNIFLYKD